MYTINTQVFPSCCNGNTIVRVEWKLPARVGDTITVNRLTDGDTAFFTLTNQDGKVCTTLEFK